MFSQFFEKYQKWSLIVSALMFLLAIFLIFRPLESLSTFIILFAIIILVNGIIKLIQYFRTDAQMRMMNFGLAEGILSILAALIIMISSNALIAFLPIMFSIWIIIQSIITIQLAMGLKFANVKGWWVMLILSIVTLLLGILVMFNPFASMAVTTTTVGIILAITQAINLVEGIVTIIKMKK